MFLEIEIFQLQFKVMLVCCQDYGRDGMIQIIIIISSCSMLRKVYWVNLTNYCGDCVENKLANYQYCDIWWRSKCHLNMVWSRGDLGLILVTMANSILQHQCNMLLASNTVILNLYFLLAMTVIIKLYQKE